MSPRQLTFVRSMLFGGLLVFLVDHEWQAGFFAKGNDTFVGALVLAIGVAAFVMRARLNKSRPDLNKQLEPVWGYTLPRFGQVAVLWFVVFLGAGLIVWGQWP